MPAEADASADPKAQELAAIIREIRERVRAQHPNGGTSGAAALPLPDLMPLLHARDAAEGKVASIGSVNPRPGGLMNTVIQAVKRAIARGLGWFVRDQVEFNRAILACVEAQLEACRETNRSFAVLAARLDEYRSASALLSQETSELKDIRSHWHRWREEWERKLFTNEVQFLRAVADLQAGFQHRTLLMEDQYRDLAKQQHAQFTASVGQAITDVQKRLWSDLERVRLDYERLIHQELRIIRQRAAVASVGEPPISPVALPTPTFGFDYGRFAERFRGSDSYVREKQKLYVPYFVGKQNVLDVGCGRGEFLTLMRDSGVAARGIDQDERSVALCRAAGLNAEQADMFAHLASSADLDLEGIFCAQVVEHLPPERVPEFVRLASAKLRRGGVLAIETPNPECLAIFSMHFFLDPTHTRPVPPALLVFYLEEFGFGGIQVHRLSPAAESIPAVSDLPQEIRETFFGGLDYAVTAVKL